MRPRFVSFPEKELRSKLSTELEKVAEDSAVIRPSWEPLLDSKRVVSVIVQIEGMFPNAKLPPDKVVRAGGYRTVKEAIEDIIQRIRALILGRDNSTVNNAK